MDLSKRDLLTKVNALNRYRINRVFGVFIVVHLVHMILFWPATPDPQSERWHLGVISIHGALLAFLLLLMPVKLLLERHEEKHLPILNLMPAIAACFYLLGGTALAIVDQQVTSSINPLMIVAVGVPLVIVLRPGVALVQYLLATLFLFVGVAQVQRNPDLLLTIRLNGFSVIALGFGLALLQWRNQTVALKQEHRIAEQQRELEAKNRELTVLATQDSLTGLLNRAQFDRNVEEAIGAMQRTARPACLVMADVDRFKSINDTHGHPVGDRILMEVARLFTGLLGEQAIIGRLGGEEFAILMPGLSLPEGIAVTERLRTAISGQGFNVGGESIAITVSFGVAELVAGMKDGLAQAYRAADIALYQAKDEGRNRVRAFGPGVAVGQAAFSVQPIDNA